MSFEEFKKVLNPEIKVNGRAYRIPCILVPQWNAEMGTRLMHARKWFCNRVDRRTRDWRHQRFILWREENPCKCISQDDFSRKLSISQSQLSLIERGKVIDKVVDIELLLSAFDRHYGVVLYILTGWNMDEIELIEQKVAG